MSAGPIAQARAAHVAPPVSTSNDARVCKSTDTPGRGYCGRGAKGDKVATDWARVVCTDCAAAYRADAAVGVGS